MTTKGMNGSRRSPLPVGKMQLMIPDGELHRVVGRSYDDERAHQRHLVEKIIQVGHDDETSTISTQSQTQHKDQSTEQSASLAELINIFPIGSQIIAHLWHDDTPAVGRLASASRACSDAVAIHVSRFNLPLGDYQDCDWGAASVLEMAEGRRKTIGMGRNLFVGGRDDSIPFFNIKHTPQVWSDDTLRQNLWDVAQKHKADASVYPRLVPFILHETALRIREGAIGEKRQMLGLPALPERQRYRLLMEMNYAIPMLRSFNEYGRNLKALRLHKVPMMDTRFIELILSVCPKLEVLGVIDCELLHFSHIIPLLDAIHWNSKQVKKRPIKLDFYPRTYHGPQEGRQGTYIISWESLPVNPQLHVLATVLLAVLKAEPMGIDLVSKDQSFRKFLELVPMRPGAMAILLHHLFNWIDATKKGKQANLIPPHIREHLEEQVLLALHQGLAHDMQHHLRDRYFDTFECSTCNHRMVKPLFSREMAMRPESDRVCRVCILDYHLSNENHHHLIQKHRLLTRLLTPCEKSAEQEPRGEMEAEDLLRNAEAPLMQNPFILYPELHSKHRQEALDAHVQLARVGDIVDPIREYDILDISGEAALLDAKAELQELDGVWEDHPRFTLQVCPVPKRQKQSWEYSYNKDTTRNTAEKKDTSFW